MQVLPQCFPVQVNHQCFARPEIVVRVFSGRGRPSRSLKHRVWARFGNPQSSEPSARKSWDTGSTEIQNILSQFCPKRWFLSIFVLDKISSDYSHQLQCMRVSSGGFQHDSEQRPGHAAPLHFSNRYLAQLGRFNMSQIHFSNQYPNISEARPILKRFPAQFEEPLSFPDTNLPQLDALHIGRYLIKEQALSKCQDLLVDFSYCTEFMSV